jgi:2-amino-4-hydroxy-6-hydroxymethyldihydropteridine diphosphokinase
VDGTQQTVTAYLGLGTNLGDREANLEEAITRLERLGAITKRSQVIETEPWGFTDQPRFLNMVVALQTDLPPDCLLTELKSIENEMGRVATFRYGPRLIDLDILLYGDKAVELPGLNIPHPRMAERSFVMEPLAEIAPEVADRFGAR